MTDASSHGWGAVLDECHTCQVSGCLEKSSDELAYKHQGNVGYQSVNQQIMRYLSGLTPSPQCVVIYKDG